jgi:hypothetical protein
MLFHDNSSYRDLPETVRAPAMGVFRLSIMCHVGEIG